MVLRGKIISGMGNAAFWVKRIEELFLKKEGIKLFHGTLNIKLDKDYKLNHYWIIEPEEYGGMQNVYVQKCKVMGNESYIVRAERTIHKEDVIEIVSNIHFRKKYNLKNDDEIEIII